MNGLKSTGFKLMSTPTWVCKYIIGCFLVVGTNVGDISIWEVGSRERLVHKTFKVWDISTCSTPLQVKVSSALVLFLFIFTLKDFYSIDSFCVSSTKFLIN